MANYCTNCGAPSAGAFCVTCGKPIDSAAGAAQQPAPPAQAAAKSGGGSAVKLVAIVVGVLMLFGLTAVAGLAYLGYRAKQKIEQVAREYGVGTESKAASGTPVASGDQPGPIPPGSARGGCPMLPAEEASRTLGIAVERAELTRDRDGNERCNFFVSLEERQRFAKSQVGREFGRFVNQAQQGNEKESQKGAEGVVLGALNALQSMAENAPTSVGEFGESFSLTVIRRNVEHEWAGLETTQAGAKAVIGVGLQPVEGLGEQAYMAIGGGAVFVRKGGAMIHLEFLAFGPGSDKGIALGRSVVGRL